MKSAFVTALIVFLPLSAFAHGESVRGVGGVGANTIGGEVSSGWALSLRYDLRNYSVFSDQALMEYQSAGQNVHQHAREHTVFLGGSWGFAPNWDVNVLLQANRFEGFVDNGDAFALTNRTLSRTTESQGLGDMLVLTRYQFVHIDKQHISFLGGIKLPTGDVRRRTNQGDIVGTHNQPGSGSVDFQLGAGYSGSVASVLLSADTMVRINTEGAGNFRSGNSLQADVAAGMRFWSFLVPSVELNAFFQQQDIENDTVKTNSGVNSLFVTPSVRCTFGAHSVFVAAALPLWQDFPGISNREQFRLSLGYSLSFGGPEDHHHHHHDPPAPSAPTVQPPAETDARDQWVH